MVKKVKNVTFWTLPQMVSILRGIFFNDFVLQSFLKSSRSETLVPVEDSSALNQHLDTLLGIFWPTFGTTVDGLLRPSDSFFVEALQHFLFVYCWLHWYCKIITIIMYIYSLYIKKYIYLQIQILQKSSLVCFLSFKMIVVNGLFPFLFPFYSLSVLL